MSDKSLPSWILVVVALVFIIAIWQIHMGITVHKIGVPNVFEIEFENSTPVEQPKLAPENVLYSDYHDMYANVRYLFGVCIARNDSLKEAQSHIPTGISLNATKGGEITYTYGHPSNITVVPMNVSKSAGAGVNLTGDGTFIITPTSPETSKVLAIPDNNPGHNFAIWQWWVEPQKEGFHTLFLDVYTVDIKGQHTPLESKNMQIDVAVIPAPPTLANVTAPAKAENVTTPAPAAAEKPANATAAAKPANATAPAAATKTPGFEGIFAITDLMAVAYLVLGRKH